MFAVLPTRRGKIFVSVFGWCSRYDDLRFLYVPSPQVFSYCTGIYKDCQVKNWRVEFIARMENALMTMGCLLAACRIGSASHLFGHTQFGHHCNSILVLLQTGVLEIVGIYGLYDLIRFVGYDPVLCFLALRRSQGIYWSRFGGNDQPSFGYEFSNGTFLGVPPLRASKISKTRSGVIVDTPGCKISRLQDVRLATVASSEAEWC